MPNFMLYYIHGYLSAPNSTKGTLFKEKLNAIPIKYRDCPPEKLIISDCLDEISKKIKNESNAYLIGSSLGGYLAAKTALENNNVKKLFLLNPATIPPDYDINKITDMPMEILKDMKDKSIFEEKISSEIFILLGTLDDVVPNRWPIEFAKAQLATIKFLKDDHSFSKNIEKLPDIINTLLSEKH